MSVISPEIDDLLGTVDSKYTLCIIAARRARQINDMAHGLRDQALMAMPASEIARITSAKPISKAMEEIATGDISFERTSDSYK